MPSQSKSFVILFRRAIICYLIFLFICIGSSIRSQAQPENVRPSVGLTLSGGGAKGLAHIGILQAIDSAGLKIDYITGTSMGSIMGALYAAGYSGDSIEKLAREIDWSLLFSTSPSLNNIGIEEKSEYDEYIVEIPFEDGKFKIGKGFIEGQELWLKFSELFQPVYNINDFSKFSIPFKCIGTDLSTGNPIEMDHGNIVTAIRASMAIPSVFTPVKYEDKILVDGGVVNNFPVQNVKKMGAGYVIGVNVSDELPKAEELETSLDILLQIGFFKDAQGFEKQKAGCNLYITPNIKNYSTGSFDASDSIIDIGIETGKKYYSYFKKIADSLNAIQPVPFVKDRLPKNTSIHISKYSLDGLKNTTSDFFFGLLDLPENKDYSHKKMSESIRRVYGSRYYKIIKYDFLPMPGDKTELHFNVQEQALTMVKFALNYTNFNGIGLKFNITRRDIIFKESRALASVQLSQNPRAYVEYYKFINKRRNMRLNLNFYGEASDYPVFRNFRPFETLRNYYYAGEISFQYNLNPSSYIGIAQQRIHIKRKTVETSAIEFDANNQFWCSNLSYILSNTNRKYFPVKGWNVRAEAGYNYGHDPDGKIALLGQDELDQNLAFYPENYLKIYLNTSHYSELDDKFTLSQNISFGYTDEHVEFVTNHFQVGGVNEVFRNQYSFVGLDESEIKTKEIVSARLGLQYEMFAKTYLTGRANIALYNYLDDITAEDNLLSGYGLSFGYYSAIGPIEVTAMYSDQDGRILSNILLGFVF